MKHEPIEHSEERIRTYYQTLSAMGKEAMREKEAAGETMHLARLGFRNVKDAYGRSTVEPDPETYPLVMEAKRMREEGYSIRKICKVMEEKGLRSKRGNVINAMGMWRAINPERATAANYPSPLS